MNHSVIGLLLGICFGLLLNLGYNTFIKKEPHARDIMTVHNTIIPNHRLGDDPFISYNRTIHKNGTLQWYVEYHILTDEGWFNYCTTDTYENDYSIDEIIPSQGVTLYEWYSFGDCKEKAKVGKRKNITVWIDPVTGTQIRNASNIYEVTEK